VHISLKTLASCCLCAVLHLQQEASGVEPSVTTDDGDRFTRLGNVVLDIGTLAELQDQFGPTPLQTSGDAGEFLAWICYETPDGVVAFRSGEMGGPDNQLLGFVLKPKADTSERCSSPSKRKIGHLEIGGLRLGMTKPAFLGIVGPGTVWKGDAATVVFESTRKYSAEALAHLPADVQRQMQTGEMQDYLDVTISLDGRFEAGLLTYLQVWKIESN
jgi:hypothetical protein